MKLVVNKMLRSHWAIGVNIDNWGYPVRNDWAISLDLLKWNISLELYKHE